MSDTTPSDEKDLGTLAEQGQQVAHNMTEVFDISSQIWKKFLATQLENGGGGAGANPDPLNTWPTFAELWRTMAENPKQVADMTLEYWSAQNALWQQSMRKWIGATEPGEEFSAPFMAKPDKRFAHKEWSENALFDYMKRSYLLTSGWIQDTVGTVGEMDPKERKKAAFYTRQFVEAMNPANFFALNPEVLEATVNEKGENLVRGLKMMLADLERGKGKLLIRQTDMDAFEVGRNVAISPGAVVWQNDLLQLIQYAPTTEKVLSKPLVIVPPWINKYYVLDLNPKKSMVKWLVDQGHTVFMVSWVNPGAAQGAATWETYMDAVETAIDKALEETGQRSLHIASYCIGGTLTATLLAEMGRKKDKRVASATFFTAQLDFEDAGELQIFVDNKTIGVIGNDMQQGFMPADRMANAFNMLRANDLIWGYMVSNYMLGKDPFPFDLLYWNADSTAMPAQVHHFYLDQFYIKNAFANNCLSVDSHPVALSDINVPVYHMAAKEDHIAPAASVYRGAKEMKSTEVRFVLAGSGHIAGVVNPPALGKYQHWVNPDLSAPDLATWCEGAEEVAGSWWPDWDAWLKTRSGRLVAPREPGSKIGTIEPAPGSYVRVRFDQPQVLPEPIEVA